MGASVSPDGRYIYAGARTGAAGYNQMLGTTQVVDVRPRDRPARAAHAEPRRRLSASGEPRRQVARVRLASHGGDGPQAARARVRRRALARADIQRDDIESRGTRDLLPATRGRPTRRRSCSRTTARSGASTPPPASSRDPVHGRRRTRCSRISCGSTIRSTTRRSPSARSAARARRPTASGSSSRRSTSCGHGPAVGHAAAPDDDATNGEHSPVWSPDGRYIAYVSWTEEGGDI